MHLRPARFLAAVLLCALSWGAWGQEPETAETDLFAPIEMEGGLQVEPSSMDSTPGGGVVFALYIYFLIAFTLFLITSTWIVYAKADRPGWACLIPIYNIIVLLQIAGKPWWWLFLYMIPVVGLIIMILHMIALAEAFGKGAGYGIGLFFLGFIFFPLLAFGDAEYSGGNWGNI